MGSPELPSGTVTFLFTDIEGSTRLLKQLGEHYQDVLSDHQAILRRVFAEHDGREVDTQGDSFFVAFRRAKDAVSAAVAAQRELVVHEWPEGVEVRVRMGIHTGEPVVGEERYVGMGVHRAARVGSAGHGGQVLLSSATRELVEDDLPEGVALRDLGLHRLKDIDRPERIFQVVVEGLPWRFPPLKTAGRAQRRPALRTGLAAVGALIVAGVAIGVFVLTQGGPGAARAMSVGADAVGAVDAKSGRVAAQVSIGQTPSHLAVGEGAVWVANVDSDTVSRIDLRTRVVVQSISVGAGPDGVVVGGGAVWVVNALDATVSRIDPSTNAVVQTIHVGSAPGEIAYGAGAVWVANSGDSTVSEIDPASGRVVGTVAAGPGASGVAVGFGSLWLTSGDTGSVSRLDLRTRAVVQTINVGNGPGAVAAGAGAVWVANKLDGTVSRIDPGTNTVTGTIKVGAGPNGVAVGAGAVWVTSAEAGTVTAIDPSSDRPRVLPVGAQPSGVAISSGSVLVAVRGPSSAHRGGTLTVDHAGGIDSIDPAIAYQPGSWDNLIMTNDGLLAYERVGGIDGSTLVPNLATTLPPPTNGGTTYTFQLRPGIRYSTWQLVRPEDFRTAIERLFTIKPQSPGIGYYLGIVGGAACAKTPAHCNLARGITVDDKADTVSFHLTAPDPAFPYALALPFADALPAGAPNHDIGTRPLPATGPYEIARYLPGHSLVLVRNRYFRQWSQAAQPDGFPDRIVWRLDVDAHTAVRGVERGRVNDAWDGVPQDLLQEATTRFASQAHANPTSFVGYYALNTRVPPFNDVRVRQALNYAIDRKHLIGLLEASGGLFGTAQPACQVLPPNFPGHRPYCPYTLAPNAAGTWSAPDLSKAKKLVNASRTRGDAVTVLEVKTDRAAADYLATVLRILGYRAQVRLVNTFTEMSAAVADSRNKTQLALAGWFPDYPAAPAFFKVVLSCSSFHPANPNNTNLSEFCNPSIDRQITHALALQATNPTAANTLWARIDREIVDQAPWLILENGTEVDFVSRRVGNYQFSPQWNILLDQLWLK